MNTTASVNAFLEASPRKDELEILRSILLETELSETIKWGAPHYTLDGKIVLGIAGFKSYAGLWFHQGVFLKDPAKVLVSAQRGATKALRQWRFVSIKDIDTALVKTYVLEAIQNQKDGKEIKPQPKRVTLPDELKEALAGDVVLSEAFGKLTPGRRNEYAEYIGGAKQEKTRISRLEKCIPMVIHGVGLNDRYKS
ncbi:MAG: YdeI/OmpD-associated family protein [Flavobacteriales bacterium]|nr:YdeI/OmpD-associated family protein [Flavobacteriales bacterium]